MPLGLGTDWNALLAARVRGSGRWPAIGLAGELDAAGRQWSAAVRGTRLSGANAQDKPVVYDGHVGQLAPVPVLRRQAADRPLRDRTYAGEGRWLWQAKALVESASTSPGRTWSMRSRTPASRPCPRLHLALGLTNGADPGASDYFNAGSHRPGSDAARHGRAHARPAPRRRHPRRPGAVERHATGRHRGSPDDRSTAGPTARLRLQPRRPQPLRDAPGHAPGPEERRPARRR